MRNLFFLLLLVLTAAICSAQCPTVVTKETHTESGNTYYVTLCWWTTGDGAGNVNHYKGGFQNSATGECAQKINEKPKDKPCTEADPCCENYPFFLPGDYRFGVQAVCNDGSTGGYKLQKLNLPKPLFVKAFPNPSSGSFTVEYNSASTGLVKLAMYDKNGTLVFTKNEIAQKGKNDFTLGGTHFKSGTYLFEVRAGNLQQRTVVVIQN